jgi:hypothetical protein
MPYESRIAGFMSVALQAFITGEFSGRRPSDAGAGMARPVCQPSDYESLHVVGDDRAAFDQVYGRCKWVQIMTRRSGRRIPIN